MLKLSTRGRYGLRAMLDLAGEYGTRPTPMGLIAQRQGLSRKYLHALLAGLKDAGLVRSVRGAHGGYELARAPDDIHVGDVVRAMEGELAVVDCLLEPGNCPRVPDCAARRLWQDLNSAMSKVLDGLTLAALADGEGRDGPLALGSEQVEPSQGAGTS
jgi:Rrf2 family cysteine metabolism transcriptional repressor